MGGMRVIPDDIVRAAAAFSCVCKRSYGSTEAPTLTTGSAGEDPAVLAPTDGRPIWPSWFVRSTSMAVTSRPGRWARSGARHGDVPRLSQPGVERGGVQLGWLVPYG